MIDPVAIACRALWASVIERAWKDATGPLRSPDGQTPPKRARDEARAWFERGGRDFRRACEFAGQDPDAVRDRYLAAVRVAE